MVKNYSMQRNYDDEMMDYPPPSSYRQSSSGWSSSLLFFIILIIVIFFLFFTNMNKNNDNNSNIVHLKATVDSVLKYRTNMFGTTSEVVLSYRVESTDYPDPDAIIPIISVIYGHKVVIGDTVKIWLNLERPDEPHQVLCNDLMNWWWIPLLIFIFIVIFLIYLAHSIR